MTEEWKDAIKQISPEILNKLHIVACEQNDCGNQGEDKGKCVYCADMAESIVGTYLHLTKS